MKQLGRLGAFLLVGLGLAYLFKVDVDAAAHTPWYRYFAFTLLAIGLFSGTYSLDVAGTKREGKLILNAVTIGVVLKALIIGAVLVLSFQDPIFWVLGVAVAQIDPLAVAALMGDERMSPRARTILGAWSSFDDPVTVLITIYLATFLSLHHPSPLGWAVDLAGNLALAAVTILLYRKIPVLAYLWLAAALIAAIALQWMLAVALIGFLCSPRRIGKWVGWATTIALACATILLGVMLSGGVDLWPGILLGLAAFAAQVIVGWLLTTRLPRRDRVHLSLAQQNGITAIILALALQIDVDFAVAVIAPAILVVNLTHLIANRIYDRFGAVRDLAHGEVAAGPGSGEPDRR